MQAMREICARNLCQHCGASPITRGGRLCYRCWHTPGVRQRYVGRHRSAHRGVGLDNPASPPLPAPTRARPGSLEKIEVLEGRAAAGLALWHPEDLVAADDGDDGDLYF